MQAISLLKSTGYPGCLVSWSNGDRHHGSSSVKGHLRLPAILATGAHWPSLYHPTQPHSHLWGHAGQMRTEDHRASRWRCYPDSLGPGWVLTAPRVPGWSPSGLPDQPGLIGSQTKAGPGSIWTPVRPWRVGGGFLQTLSPLRHNTLQCSEKEALTECSSWSILWARTGLKETGDRAPGFFLTARICRRARKAVAERKESKGWCQARAGSSTTKTLQAPGTTRPHHNSPGTSQVSESGEQSHNKTSPVGKEARMARPSLDRVSRGSKHGVAGLSPATPQTIH